MILDIEQTCHHMIVKNATTWSYLNFRDQPSSIDLCWGKAWEWEAIE
jgi:hypothetical protein